MKLNLLFSPHQTTLFTLKNLNKHLTWGAAYTFIKRRESPTFCILYCFFLSLYKSGDDNTVVNHYYEAEVVSEYVIKGNTAVLKCNIPSFVADFVRVEGWIASDGTEFLPTFDFGMARAL